MTNLRRGWARRSPVEQQAAPPTTKLTAARAILQGLAAQDRRVLSDWRAAVILRRATFSTSPSERRWTNAPNRVEDVWPILRQMHAREEIRPISRPRHVYVVTVPYATTGLVDENEILMEIQPYAALSHMSALFYHELTQDLPKQITATVPRSRPNNLLPLDTEAGDWEGLSLVRGALPDLVQGHPIQWTRISPSRYFGIREYRSHGFPMRVTDVERTLLDGLQRPELAGGIENVLRAWALSQDILDLDALVNYVNQFGLAVLRQRVGFILDELHIHHPEMAAWRAQARRGGSSKLLGSAPYSRFYSERWNLSINAPVTALQVER